MRIDPALWTEIESWAQEEMRSVNGQIEYLLRAAVQKRKGAKPSAGDNVKKPPAEPEQS